ncbi:MAG TPA: DUF3240 family protein [Myxococcota bacterium]|nr:DUF3240 family protein [Myxococcota bacterium]
MSGMASPDGGGGPVHDTLVTLIATPELEETLVDWLLDRDYRGFTTFDCAGHGVVAGLLSTAEQVSGRQTRVGFWLAMPRAEARSLVERLGVDLAGAGLHYWLTPLLAAGRIGGSTRPD